MYYAKAGTSSSISNMSAYDYSDNPLAKQWDGVTYLHVDNGNVYISLYYSSYTKYSLKGDYLVTVMLMPTS